MKSQEKKYILRHIQQQDIFNSTDGPSAMIVRDSLGNNNVIKTKHIWIFVLILVYKADKKHIFPCGWILVNKNNIEQ